ncbi:GM12346 [Drosophila sechellia]|uniref:GM12346 n=1 Tax=Drosophila sechellia TaxID=7238 RepID=B4I0Z0_DROSE|nr:GM12346 [Drosophila sechellia]
MDDGAASRAGPETGIWDARCRVQDAGCWLLDVGRWTWKLLLDGLSCAVSATLVLATQLTRTRQILAPATPTAYFWVGGWHWVWANKKRNKCTPM